MKRILTLRLCQFTVVAAGHIGHWLHSPGRVLLHLHTGRRQPSHPAGAIPAGRRRATGH